MKHSLESHIKATVLTGVNIFLEFLSYSIPLPKLSPDMIVIFKWEIEE